MGGEEIYEHEAVYSGGSVSGLEKKGWAKKCENKLYEGLFGSRGDKYIGFRVSQELYEVLTSYARWKGVSLSNLVRTIILNSPLFKKIVDEYCNYYTRRIIMDQKLVEAIKNAPVVVYGEREIYLDNIIKAMTKHDVEKTITALKQAMEKQKEPPARITSKKETKGLIKVRTRMVRLKSRNGKVKVVFINPRDEENREE
ncbi:MAG: hypothetical protein J7L82_07180 [Staphylothermus sp.]|nr:hypothetical protein [Staphylothermus sp.]